jgi:hypothetical protein
MQKTVKYPREDSKKKESDKGKSKKRKGKKNKSKSTKKNKNEKNTNDNEKKNINSFAGKCSQPNISKKLNAKDEQQNSIKNLESKSNIKIDTKEINKHKNITTDIISNELTEEEKNIITKEILEDFEEDKLYFMEEITDNVEENLEGIQNKKKKNKYTSIEVEENIGIEENNQRISEQNLIPINEVKNIIFKKPCKIENEILFDGKIFIIDRRQTSKYPDIINYRCKNYRKNERNRKELFCKAILKRKKDKKKIYYILEKEHSKECLELIIQNKKIETNLIGNYNDFINKCYNYLDSTENYNKKEFRIALENIYNENKYNYKLKENTIKNIIGRWRSNSLRFTKYNAIEHKYSKINELIFFCEYNNCAIYTSNKKYPISSEYFIWSSSQIIARARNTLHLFIDATFHHPVGYGKLLIIIFKDIITSDYLPCFFILMSNKTEILYNMIFISIKKY